MTKTRQEAARSREGKQHCRDCIHLDTTSIAAAALGDGVGWCRAAGQYRAINIERVCERWAAGVTATARY